MTVGEDDQNGYQLGACWCGKAARMRCRRCCQTNRYADGHVVASRLTRSGTLPTHANGQGKSRKRLEQESLGATGMLWLLLQCGCCCSAATNTVALLLLLLGAKYGQDVYLAGQMLPPSLAPEDCTPIVATDALNVQNVATTYVLNVLLLCHGQLVPMQTWLTITMDSTPAACAAAPEWHWFWVWFGLLVLVNVATEIALCTIAATTRHLLVCLTSLGHHTI